MPNLDDRPVHALSFDIEDWFHMVEIPGLDDPSEWPNLPSLVERRTEEILDVCREAGVRATFFILGWIAERHPRLVAAIAAEGHELGSHSHWHRAVYEMTPESFQRDLEDSIAAIESAAGRAPTCFRAPSFSIKPGSEWAFDAIAESGLRFDASLFPARRGHGGYPCPDHPHMVVSPRGVRLPELPMSTMSVAGARLCFSGGGYLRLLPLAMIRRGFRQCEREKRPAVVYLHPRDFAPDCPRCPMPAHRRFKGYVGLATTRRKLEALVGEYRFGTCGEVVGQAGRSASEDGIES
jgi:polysaccharide deacetylase family protein (PEP-CTERM system associated)